MLLGSAATIIGLVPRQEDYRRYFPATVQTGQKNRGWKYVDESVESMLKVCAGLAGQATRLGDLGWMEHQPVERRDHECASRPIENMKRDIRAAKTRSLRPML
jgi:hypothetical protein